MEQWTTARFIDDLDGSDGVGTVTFALGNRSFEIDLSDENTDRLHEALEPVPRIMGLGRGARS